MRGAPSMAVATVPITGLPRLTDYLFNAPGGATGRASGPCLWAAHHSNTPKSNSDAPGIWATQGVTALSADMFQ